MSSDEPETPAEITAEAAAETAKIRRRWLTLGEILAVAAVLISALGLWNSYADRKTGAAERAAAEAGKAAERTRVGLIATGTSGSALSFKGANCALQSADIAFPAALGVPAQNTVLEHRIEAAWFEDKLLELTDGGPDRREGRLPVIIASRCESADGTRLETAIYDIAFRIEPRVLRGRAVRLRGLVRREAVGEDGPAALDALWAQVQPTISSGLKK